MSKNTKFIIILILLSGVLFFFKLGSFSLYNAAETTYGEFIRQIRLTGDWVTLRYNSQVIFDKPPLYFWLASIATFLFGFNEFAIRFWAAVCGVLTVVTTYFLGKSFYNERVGFLSGIILMTAFQFMIQSRIAEIDILLTLLMATTFFFFWQGYQSRKTQHYWMAYVAMALALLTKGVIGIAIPVFAIFLFLWIKRQLPRIKEMQIIAGIIIIAVIGTPWYIAEWMLYGKQFGEFVLGFLFLSRFGGVVAGHPGPWYYYILALILGFAPWSHFLPYAFWRTRQNNVVGPALLSLCFIVPVLIVFSIAKTKLPSYILPLYPFLAIMVAKLWDDFLGVDQKKMYKGMAIANGLLAIIAGMIIIGFILVGKSNYAGLYEEFIPILQVLMGVLILGSLASIILFIFKRYKLSFAALPTMVFIIMFILTTMVLPGVDKLKGEKELGIIVSKNIKEGEFIAAYNTGNRPGIVFYNSKPIIFLDSEQALNSFLKNKKGYCFTTRSELKKIKKDNRVFAKQGELVILY